MKKSTIAAVLFFLLLTAIGYSVSAQKASNFKVENGKVVKVEKKDKVKVADPVYAVSDGVTFYQGSRGGIYFWGVDKTGKKVKRYIKK